MTNAATLEKNELHPVKGTPKLAPAPVVDREVPATNPLTPVTFLRL